MKEQELQLLTKAPGLFISAQGLKSAVASKTEGLFSSPSDNMEKNGPRENIKNYSENYNKP
jgi:hypothetical protein